MSSAFPAARLFTTVRGTSRGMKNRDIIRTPRSRGTRGSVFTVFQPGPEGCGIMEGKRQGWPRGTRPAF